MRAFEKALNFTLGVEGGFVNNPKDPGGATNFGITLGFMEGTRDCATCDVDGDGDIDLQDLKKMTRDDAGPIYRKYFWDKLKLDNYSPKLGLVVFDAAVNHGLKNAIKFLQKTCNEVGAKIEVDGVYGPTTVSTATKNDSSKFVETYLVIREKFYDAIVANNPSQSIFLKGWKNRIALLRKFISNNY